ncbi:MAG: FMN-binding protein [Desulfobacteraceae bacterium]|nr:FMN-binding protein [Desulfobacteraceae bacterium]
MTQTQNGKAEKARRFQNSHLAQAWLCIVLALFFGGALAAVEANLGPIIAANKLNESKARVPELLLGAESGAQKADQGQAMTVTPRTVEIDKKGIKKFYTVFEASYADGRPAGWVTKVGGQGYADRIELLLGLTPDLERITGLFILDQKETPGLGNKIVEPKWRDQFKQKATHPGLKVVKTGAQNSNEIDAVTGATISSRSVVNIVNESVADLKKKLSTVPESGKDK